MKNTSFKILSSIAVGVSSFAGIYISFLLMNKPIGDCEMRIAITVGAYAFGSKLVDKFILNDK